MAPPLLMLRDIHLTFGGPPLLEGAELMVSAGERLCLVGRNGSGKSTLLRIAAGLMEPDSGERYVDPGATMRYLAQEPDLSGYDTARAFVEAGLAPGDDPHQASMLLEKLGLSGDEEPSCLSGGEARRCALAQVLAARPDILFLDEPTNHLDLLAISWLEGELARQRSALVLISHDRRFLETLSRTTVWLIGGITRRLDRGFNQFESWRDTVLEQEGSARHELNRKIAVEMDWLHKGVTARRKRNQGRLRALHALRTERQQQRQVPGTVKLTTTESAISGKRVIEAVGISKSFGEAPLIDNFSIRVQRGDRVALIGPNGAGKTTLLNILTGGLKPDAGWIKLGTVLQMVTIDQRRDSLDAATSLSDTLTGGRGDQVMVGGESRHVISYMKDFLFLPEQARTAVGALSGGERGRLILARALARPSNLLVLDEPTNDLDLETLDLLQEMLANYDGTVLLVSHDRDFLDRVATSVIAWEGDGQWIEYAGGYSDMIAQRGRGVEAKSTPSGVIRKLKRTGKASPKPPATRLSFKEKHALETLPREMKKLQADIAKWQRKLADPELFTRDPRTFNALADTLAKTEEALAATEERWLALEIKREEVEGA
jgi:ATP-binding cassette subfamily F protein uup